MTRDDQPTYLVLDQVSGWRDDIRHHLSQLPDGGLAVDCVPGQPFDFAKSIADKFQFPLALAIDAKYERLYLFDAGENRIKVLDLQMQNLQMENQCGTQFKDEPANPMRNPKQPDCGDLEFSVVPGVGGKGKQAREFLNARGLAMLPDGSLVVADTGNNQIKIFSSFPHALLAVWGSGKPGDGAMQFKRPWKVAADKCGLIYIADRGNGRIQRVQRDGTPRDSITGLDPIALAVHTDRTLAVQDGDTLRIFPADSATWAQKFPVPSGSCLTFDDAGYLYAGTSTGLVYKFAPEVNGGLRPAGIGVTGQDAKFLDLLWVRNDRLVGILLKRCESRPNLCALCTCAAFASSVDDPVDDTADALANGAGDNSGAGVLITKALDSKIEGCPWHRIELDATIPAATVIEVGTQTSETEWPKDAAFKDEGFSYSSAHTKTAVRLTGNNPDCLVQSAPGRYLRVQVRLLANGVKSPVLRALRIHFPRESYLQYLPAVYQEDDESRLFLERFLSIFQTTFDGLDWNVNDLWMRFDPASVPETWFPWLASWIALPLNPRWFNKDRKTSLKDARFALKKAGSVYPRRGTPGGIEELIKEYSGVDARLVEHFRLRQLVILGKSGRGTQATADYLPQLGESPLCAGTRLWSRDYYQRLQVGVYSRVGYFRLTGEPEPGLEPLAWGANEFSVFFDCEPYHVKETQGEVEKVVEREKPAHTKANYCPVLPRMRVGVQSTLGVDTRIGETTPLLLGTTGTLGYDSILGCLASELNLLAQNASHWPQVDVTSRLQ